MNVIKSFIKNENNKKFFIVVFLLFFMSAFTFGVIVFFVPEDNDVSSMQSTVSSNISLGEQDVVEVESLSETFFNEVSNFGVVSKDGLTPGIISNVSYVALDSPGDVTSQYMSRVVKYEDIVDKNMIYSDSPLLFNNDTISKWNSGEETNMLATYESSNVKVKLLDASSFTRDLVSGEDLLMVKVNVSWDTFLSFYVPTGSSVDWDGSYNVLEKNMRNNDMVMTLIKDSAGQWKIFDVDSSVACLTVVCENPSYADNLFLYQGADISSVLKD